MTEKGYNFSGKLMNFSGSIVFILFSSLEMFDFCDAENRHIYQGNILCQAVHALNKKNRDLKT